MRAINYCFAALILSWAILNFALQVHEPGLGEGSLQSSVSIVSTALFCGVALKTIMGVGSALAAEYRGTTADAATSLFVNIAIWFSWWIELYSLVLFIFKDGGYFDSFCSIPQLPVFYCNSGRTAGAFVIIFLILQTCLVGHAVNKFHTSQSQQRGGTSGSMPNGSVVMLLLVAGFVGQLFWGCAMLKLANQTDQFLAVDLQLLLGNVLIQILFTVFVGFAARVLYGATQSVGHVATLVSGVCACVAWSFLITDGRRLNDINIYLPLGNGALPPCNGGVHCAETAVIFVGLLLMTLDMTGVAVLMALGASKLSQDSTRRDGLLNESDNDTGSYYPATAGYRQG